MGEGVVPITSARLTFIDALRGFALFGVFGANLFIFSGFIYMTEEQQASLMTTAWDEVSHALESFFVENKFIGLFSLLFGVSFWLFLNRVRSRSGSATGLFFRRIGWLFVIGAVHGWLLWCFDVLRFYALWAVFLPLFVHISLRRLLVAALSAAVLFPALISGMRGAMIAPSESGAAYDALALSTFATGSFSDFLKVNWFYDWYLTNSIGQLAYQLAVFGRLLLGLYAARALDLANLEGHRPLLRRILVVGTIAGIVGNSVVAADLIPSASRVAATLSHGAGGVVVALAHLLEGPALRSSGA